MAIEDAEKSLLGEGERASEEADWEISPRPRRLRNNNTMWNKAFWGIMIGLPWALLAVSLIWSWRLSNYYKTRYYIPPDLAYSPAQEIVEYHLQSYTTGLVEDADSPYAAEPSDEVDKLWKGLYPSLLQLIPQSQAAKLPNKTIIYPHDPQRRYAIELDVFHQLHCLNQVRKATRPDYYHASSTPDHEDPLLGHRHIAHCINEIRQGLMCAADITPYTWTWDDGDESGYRGYRNQVRNAHVCRNFEDIREWAIERAAEFGFDNEVRVENDPLNEETWVDGYRGE